MPGGPWHLNFALERLGKPEFLLQKSHFGHPGFHRSRTLGSPQFFLEYSLD